MSAAEIKERLSHRPFEPFRVVMSSGDSYEVRHPEMALLVRSGLYIAVPDARGRLPDAAKWCSLLHIAAIEPAPTSAPGRPANGDGSA
jgi:hypothetical protein